jgi:hypothetical protein
MHRPILAGVFALMVSLGGCLHGPSAPREIAEAAEEPAPAAPRPLTPEEEEASEVLARYTWHDNWLDNYPVLNGMAVMTELFGLWLLAVMGSVGGMGTGAHSGPAGPCH